MRLIKEVSRKVLCSRSISSFLINFALRLHNVAYYLTSAISQYLEPGNLHPKHRLIDYHTWFVSKLKTDWTVLDVGCSNGALAADLSRHCKYITAIDISAEKIHEAMLCNSRENVEFIIGDATAYSFESNFDAVILSNVLEHIENRVLFLRQIAQYSDKFIIRVPMIDKDWITLYKKERGVPYMLDPSHFVEYTYESFKKEVLDAGLIIRECRVRYGELYSICEKLN